MKKLLVATTLAALTITTPTTVSAKPNNVRYSTGIVTGAKSITTTDGNVWHTKRKLHLCKGANVQVKFDTKGTKRKKDDASDRNKTEQFLSEYLHGKTPALIKARSKVAYEYLDADAAFSFYIEDAIVENLHLQQTRKLSDDEQKLEVIRKFA